MGETTTRARFRSSRDRLCRRILPCLLGLVFVAGAEGQQGALFVGFDAATTARAGVDVAIAEAVSALLTNPAGLVNIAGPYRVEGSLRLFHPETSYHDALNPMGVHDDRWLPAPYLGFAYDPDPSNAGRPGDWHVAVGLLHFGGFRSELDITTQDLMAPETFARDVDFVQTGVHVGGAVRLTERFSLGLTASLGAQTLDVKEPLELSVFKFGGMSPLGNTWGELLFGQLGIERVRIAGDFRSDPALSFSATLGALFEVTETFRVGLSYRTPSLQQNFRGDVDVDISRIFGEPDPVTFPDGFRVGYDASVSGLQVPQALTLGWAWDVTPNLRVAMEGKWIDWSATHDKLRLRLSNGDNPSFNAFVGSSDLNVDEVLGWRDQYILAGAVEWAFAERFVARAGLAFQTNPVPSDAANPIAPGWSRWQLGLGLGYRGDGFGLDAGWLHSFDEGISAGASRVSSDLDGSRSRFRNDSFVLGGYITF